MSADHNKQHVTPTKNVPASALRDARAVEVMPYSSSSRRGALHATLLPLALSTTNHASTFQWYRSECWFWNVLGNRYTQGSDLADQKKTGNTVCPTYNGIIIALVFDFTYTYIQNGPACGLLGFLTPTQTH